MNKNKFISHNKAAILIVVAAFFLFNITSASPQYNTITVPTKVCEQDDVSCTGLSNLMCLAWNSSLSKWTPQTVPIANLSNVSANAYNHAMLNESNTFQKGIVLNNDTDVYIGFDPISAEEAYTALHFYPTLGAVGYGNQLQKRVFCVGKYFGDWTPSCMTWNGDMSLYWGIKPNSSVITSDGGSISARYLNANRYNAIGPNSQLNVDYIVTNISITAPNICYSDGTNCNTPNTTKSIHDFTQNGQTPYLRYHLGGGMGTVGTAGAINVRDIYTLGLPITSTKCIDQFMVREATAGVSTNYTIHFAIYNTTYDGSLYLNQLVTSCYNRTLNVTNGIVNCSIAPATLKAGMYWLAIVVNGTGTPAPTILPMSGYYNFLGLDSTGANMANSWRLRGGTDYNWTGTFNQTFPSTGQLYTVAPFAIGVHYVDC